MLLLAPFAPHVSEELWMRLGHATPVYETIWPAADASALAQDSVVIMIQINGKLRSKLTVPADAAEDEVRSMVIQDEKTMEWTKGKTMKKFVYVAGKIVNMVVA